MCTSLAATHRPSSRCKTVFWRLFGTDFCMCRLSPASKIYGCYLLEYGETDLNCKLDTRCLHIGLLFLQHTSVNATTRNAAWDENITVHVLMPYNTTVKAGDAPIVGVHYSRVALQNDVIDVEQLSVVHMQHRKFVRHSFSPALYTHTYIHA